MSARLAATSADGRAATTGEPRLLLRKDGRVHAVALAEVEWFEAAYRVYLAAIFGGGALLWLSEIVGDGDVTPAQAADVVRHGRDVRDLRPRSDRLA